MKGNFQTTGIIVRKKPLGESDLLITFLSPELGLKKAIASSAREYKSIFRGRSELLMVNNFVLIKGRKLDRILQMETQKSYQKLSTSIGKLTMSQYLAELILHLAIEEPQPELYTLFLEHLRRMENLNHDDLLFAHLAQAVYHFLAVSGIAPKVHHCVYSQKPIIPNFQQPHWRVGFSFAGGGVTEYVKSSATSHLYPINDHLNAIELAFFQTLSQPHLPDMLSLTKDHFLMQKSWIRIERILKSYVEFHLNCKMRSAEVITDLLIDF